MKYSEVQQYTQRKELYVCLISEIRWYLRCKWVRVNVVSIAAFIFIDLDTHLNKLL